MSNAEAMPTPNVPPTLRVTQDRRGQWRLFADGRRVAMQKFLLQRADGTVRSCPWLIAGVEPEDAA